VDLLEHDQQTNNLIIYIFRDVHINVGGHKSPGKIHSGRVQELCPTNIPVRFKMEKLVLAGGAEIL
jgi:hypothetical protein